MASRMPQNEPPITYLTPSGSSFDWGQAFAQGCGGRAVSYNILKLKPFAAFLDPQLWAIFQEVKRLNLPYYYGDHAYFGRRVYFRTTKNAHQHDCQGESNGKRFDSLNIEIKPWKSGSKILLCPQSEIFHHLHNHSRAEWIEKTTNLLRRHTDRPIEVRTKLKGNTTESDFKESLRGVHAVVVFCSVAGVQAALEGVPCFATIDCASAKFGSMDLSRIENPVKPDNRYQMASVLADNQWTLAEMAKGVAWESLR